MCGSHPVAGGREGFAKKPGTHLATHPVFTQGHRGGHKRLHRRTDTGARPVSRLPHVQILSPANSTGKADSVNSGARFDLRATDVPALVISCASVGAARAAWRVTLLPSSQNNHFGMTMYSFISGLCDINCPTNNMKKSGRFCWPLTISRHNPQH